MTSSKNNTKCIEISSLKPIYSHKATAREAKSSDAPSSRCFRIPECLPASSHFSPSLVWREKQGGKHLPLRFLEALRPRNLPVRKGFWTPFASFEAPNSCPSKPHPANFGGLGASEKDYQLPSAELALIICRPGSARSPAITAPHTQADISCTHAMNSTTAVSPGHVETTAAETRRRSRSLKDFL